MTHRQSSALAFTGQLLGALIVLNLLYGAALLVLLAADIVAPVFTLTTLTGRAPQALMGVFQWAMVLMLVGIAAVPATHLVLTRLRAMVATVRDGDPFVAENARRLKVIALGFVNLEVLRLIVGAIIANTPIATLGMRARGGFAITPWVAVLLLFVLARVFAEGTRMRADLEGTV